MYAVRRYTKTGLFLLCMLAATKLWAQFPFQANDSESINFRHYGSYRFEAVSNPSADTDQPEAQDSSSKTGKDFQPDVEYWTNPGGGTTPNMVLVLTRIQYNF